MPRITVTLSPSCEAGRWSLQGAAYVTPSVLKLDVAGVLSRDCHILHYLYFYFNYKTFFLFNFIPIPYYNTFSYQLSRYHTAYLKLNTALYYKHYNPLITHSNQQSCAETPVRPRSTTRARTMTLLSSPSQPRMSGTGRRTRRCHSPRW